MNVPCQRCGRAKASVHITDTAPQKRELHLCEECAEKEGVIIKHHQTANAMLKEFIKQKTGLAAVENLSCPKCGMTFREFQSKGLLGCPHDYEAFQPVLGPLIERAHGGATHHVGKVPEQADVALRRQTGLQRLRRELQDALEQENYEQAARVRDQIRLLE
jgi:protein arginine kinase activator